MEDTAGVIGNDSNTLDETVDLQVEFAVQQSGFKRAKRYGMPKNFADILVESQADKNSPWQSLEEALGDDSLADPRIVHDQRFFERLQHNKDAHR